MKLKLDEKGNAVIQDGKPVYVYDDGKEIPFDAAGAVSKIEELNRESKGHRLNAKAYERIAKLLPEEAAEAPEAWFESAKSALVSIKSFDGKKVIDTAEIDQIVKDRTKPFEMKVRELEDENGRFKQSLHHEVLPNRFTTSAFVKEKISELIPRAAVFAEFGKNFSMEKIGDAERLIGKIDGRPVHSRKSPGEIADFDEANVPRTHGDEPPELKPPSRVIDNSFHI